MSVEKLGLRDVAAWTHTLESTCAWLRHAGIDFIPAEAPCEPCLQLESYDGCRSVMCLMPANEWARRHCPPLEGAPWMAMSEAILQGFMEAYRDGFADLDLLGSSAVFRGMYLPKRGDRMPMVRSAAGPVYIRATRGSAADGQASPNPVATSLELRLPPIQLPATQARHLRAGDLLMLGAPSDPGTGWIGATPVLTFTYKDPNVEIDSVLTADGATEWSEAVSGDTLGSLTVTLDAVLGSLPVTLEQLQGLRPGQVMELPVESHTKVRIRDAGRVIALGELVRVSDRLGVLLHTVPGVP